MIPKSPTFDRDVRDAFETIKRLGKLGDLLR